MQPLRGHLTSVVERSKSPWPRVVHVITGLGTGGAEMMLYKLLTATPDAAYGTVVISLTADGSVGVLIRSLGVPVYILNLNARRPNPFAIIRLAQWIRKARPDIVQTWMYHADVIGGLAAKLADRKLPVIWNVRASNLDTAVIDLGARIFARLSAWLSDLVPCHIVSCSRTAAELHIALGYPRSRLSVIPNGFDLERFQPDTRAREEIRSQLGISTEEVLIGLVARFHPMKDHATFIRAAKLLYAEVKNVRFLLCGPGVTWENAELTDWVDRAGLRSRFLLLGERSDIHLITAALDIATSASRAEGFSNVLGEAMACGIPCVATSVGDAAYIIGDTGWAVPPASDTALAQAWKELIQLGPQGRQKLGQRALERVVENFSLPAVAARYEEVYRNVATRRRESSEKGVKSGS